MKSGLRRSSTLLVGVAAAAVAVAFVAGGATARPAQTGSVCVLLPDTKSSVRWEQFDRPAFVNAFKKANVPATIVNALNDPQKQLAQAEQCISGGSRVGIITSLDTGTSIAIQKKFTAVGGKTIDYDRQIVGGTGSVYVSFDGNLVGRLQARGVLAGMKAKKTYGPNGVVAQLWGGPTDANAFWFKSGNDNILNPLFRTKKVKKGPARFVPEWDSKNAQTIFEQFLVQTNNNIQGVIGANDNIAGAVVATLKAKGPRPDRAVGPGRDGSGRPEHHLGLADQHGLQVRARRGERGRRGCGRAVQGQEAPVQRDAAQQGQEAARLYRPGVLDHQGELHASLPRPLPQAEPGVLRRVQEVLQVTA